MTLSRRALVTLSGVETWERFSFYGMQGILLLYLYYSARHGGLGIDQRTAVGIVGAYGSAVYLSTIGGAWVADRLLGLERTVLASACLIMLGHLALAVVPGAAGVVLGLTAVACGSGALKANTTAIIGGLYAADPAGRESGFAVFYLGVNVGAMIGPLLTGMVQQAWGFRVGFALAAAGMACGLVQYLWGRRRFASAFRAPANPLPARQRCRVLALGLTAQLAVGGLILAGVLTAANLNAVVMWLVVASTVVLFLVLLRGTGGAERLRVVRFVPMFVASTAFWALSQQQFTVLTVYADKQLDRSVLGWEMPVAWVQSINPVFVVLLSGVFAALWARLGARQPSGPRKFALANVVMGVAFLCFIPLAGLTSVPLPPVVGILLLFGVAELLLSPVGLSYASAIAPRAFRSQTVALFYLSIALGTSLSGVLAGWYTVRDQVPYFGLLGGASIALGLGLFALAPRVTGEDAPRAAPIAASQARGRWMREDRGGFA